MRMHELLENELDVMSADDKQVTLKDPKTGIETKVTRAFSQELK